MSGSLLAVAVAAVLTQAPCQNCQNGGQGGYQAGYGGGYQGDYQSGYSGGGYGPVSFSGQYSAVGGPVGQGSGGYDQLHPFDDPRPWVRGYWQEIPAFGGSYHFRPYNYKHVLSQSQIVAGWGMSPTFVHSQEYFRRYAPQNQNERVNPPAQPQLQPVQPQQQYPQPQYQDPQYPQPTLQPVLPQPDQYGPRVNRTSPQPGPVLQSPGAVSPVAHTRSPRTRQQLEEQIRKQTRELQELQRALDAQR